MEFISTGGAYELRRYVCMWDCMNVCIQGMYVSTIDRPGVFGKFRSPSHVDLASVERILYHATMSCLV